MNRKFLLLILALVLALLAGCEQAPAETTTQPQPTEPIEHLAVVVTEDTIGLLDSYVDLKTLDLSGSTCYEAIAQYIENHPKVDVSYTVKLGTVTASQDTTALVLDPGACDYETLAANLAYLPKVTEVQLPRTTYSAQELTALEGLYPEVAWSYSIILLGQELTKDTATLNLSVLTSDRVQEAAEKLRIFPNLTTVELMDAYGKCGLSKEDVKTLMDAAPNVRFHYVFDLFGKTVSTDDTRIEFVKQEIGNEGEGEIRAALSVLPNCEYLLLDDCGIDYEILAAIREDFRATTKVVWRVYFGVTDRYTYLTDTDTVRCVYNVTDSTCGPMKYCEDVKYMDLGHNEELHNIDFIAYMPNLEICILSGSPIESLEPFANSTKLIFLELAYCGHIDDISPLAGCTSLENLNISYTKATDMSALYELPLKQLCAVVSKIPWSEQEELMDLLPDCTFRFDGTQPYGTGWRYKKSGAYTDIYAKVREVFQLDEVDKLIAAGGK